MFREVFLTQIVLTSSILTSVVDFHQLGAIPDDVSGIVDSDGIVILNQSVLMI